MTAHAIYIIEVKNLRGTVTFHTGLKQLIQDDGEILMKTMAKTTEDVRPLYEMLIIGSNVLKFVTQEIEKVIPQEN